MGMIRTWRALFYIDGDGDLSLEADIATEMRQKLRVAKWNSALNSLQILHISWSGLSRIVLAHAKAGSAYI